MIASLAPALGRLAAPARRGRFEGIRLQMIDRLITANAVGSLTGAVWLEAWTEAMEHVRDAVLAGALVDLAAAGRESRYPAARLRALSPDPESGEVLLQRLLARGLELERLEHGDDGDVSVPRARGAALETAWESAASLAESDAGRWRAVTDEVAQWRRPYRPLILAAVPIVAAAGLIGSWLGGVVPSPRWFAPVTEWFWSVPWP